MPLADLGPAPLDLTGIIAGDWNMMGLLIEAVGGPFDLTGCTVEAMVRATHTDPVVVLTGIITIVDAVNGVCTLRFDGDAVRAHLDSVPTDKWTGVWDVQVLAPPRTQPDTVASGSFTMAYDVTRL